MRELPPLDLYETEAAERAGMAAGEPSAGDVELPAEPLLAGEARGQPFTRQSVAPLATIDLSTVPADDVTPRRWIVPDLIPDRNVTDISGDGGLGKSLLALQLGIAMAAGRDWLGTMPEPGGFLYVSCEDEPNEVLRRRNAVLAGMGLTPGDIRNLYLADLTDAEGTELAAPGKAALELTALHHRFEVTIRQLRPKCAVLDTRADVFGGNELSRVQVRMFVRSLRRLCIAHDMAIILLSHPSVSGMASGSGQSGSTGWGNSVRSRLYLTAPKSEGDTDLDPDIRILSSKKANYGPHGAEIVLRWDRGMFRPDRDALASLDRDQQDREIEVTFLQLLSKREKEGRRANASSGPNYAPKVLAEMNGTISRAKFRGAMERLFAKEEIASVSYEANGKGSTQLVLTDKGMSRLRIPF
ncbi:AAA family ATPase [Mesorhizobium japonicum]|uniref:Mlr5464 protein n=1 Tax=Mesorhizobium japonicum (strain LMG 29417 / CECT 9101 / MAFF 303099) TaxID=266835 RepID=Q98BR0_RHILO|nr:AAA family ATPase [Mesorhizobium japonicum]BAB51912.1 mlr5464 [Mesorhizobium japonicum MAFF 303099]